MDAGRPLTGNFGLYLGSRFFAATAMTLLRATVVWHVYDLSGSAFQLGLVGLVQFLPALGLTLVGGAAADSYDRRRIVMAAQTVPVACSLSLAGATAAGLASLPLLYVAIFLASVAAAFESPARAALLPTLVPREAFPRAVTVASTVQALAFASGPAASGLVIGGAGLPVAYGLHAGLVAVALAGIAGVRAPEGDRVRRAVSLDSIREGLAFVRRSPVILGCMTLDMFAVIFGGASVLLPIYAQDILAVGPRGYGILTASLEVGALLMSGILIGLPPIQRAGRALLVSVAVYGVATIVFGLSRSFPLSVLAYMVAGMADQVSVVMRHTTIQLSTPDPIRGRVSAVNMLFIGASNQLGAAESGFVAALTTATFSVVSGGLGCLVVLGLVAARLPELRRYRVDLTR